MAPPTRVGKVLRRELARMEIEAREQEESRTRGER
jgi:hypothetical protein